MNIENLIMWVIIVLLSVGLFNMFQDPNKINSEKNTLGAHLGPKITWKKPKSQNNGEINTAGRDS